MKATDRPLLKERVRVEIFRARPEGGWFGPEVIADETFGWEDLVTNEGRKYLAKRIGRVFHTDPTSGMDWTAVGTVGTAADLTDTQVTGEVARKQCAVSSATSNNVFTSVTTFGGAADSITGVVLQEAGLFNNPSSGEGTMFQRVTFSSVTPADSDLFQITMETVVGSNTI